MTIARLMKEIAEAETLMSDLGNHFVDNVDGGGYISDAIDEIADSQVDIYTSNLKKWATENWDILDEFIENGLVDVRPSSMDQLVQAAQYMQAEQQLYDGLDVTLHLWSLKYVRDHIAGDITQDQLDELELVNYWNCDTFEEVIERIEEVVGKES